MRCPNCENEIREEGVITCPICGFPVGTVRMLRQPSADGGVTADLKQDETPKIVKPDNDNLMDSVWPDWKLEKKEIGRGSYGIVYRAVHEDNGIASYSAIKVISIPTSEAEVDSMRSEGLDYEATRTYFMNIVQEFKDEISILQSLKGARNIVGIEDYKIVERTDRIGWDINIRMELLTPLNAFFADRPLSEQEVVKLGCDICSALEICEQKGIIHRDIKPENIFVNEFGDFKLGDFGIARKLERTVVASYKGSPNYMAPEVISGNEYDSRVDIYSLGLMLYRFLNNKRLPFIDTQKVPTPEEREVAWKKRIRGEEFPKPCGASDGVSSVILKACAFKPGNRFNTAKEFHDALIEAANNGAVVPIYKKKRRLIIGLIAGAIVLCALIATGIFLLLKNKDDGKRSKNTPTPTIVMVSVPTIAPGTECEEAKAILEAAGLKADVTMEHDTSIKSGCVIRTKPAAGTIVEADKTIRLVVSSGKELVDVISVVGMSQEDAEKALLDLGFEVSYSEPVSDEEIPKGGIVVQSPEADTTQEKGSEIILTVSTGKKDYYVTLDANGGTALSDSERQIIVHKGDDYGTLATPTREGYTFDGWFSAQDGGAEITETSIVEKPENHTIYAHWKANRYKVTLDLRNANAVLATKEFMATYDSHYGDALAAPTMEGYTFAGWFTAAEGGEEIKKDSKVTITEDTTFFAQWTQFTPTPTPTPTNTPTPTPVPTKAPTPIPTYSVTYDANGGTGAPGGQTKTYGTALPLSTAQPKWDYHTFKGWSSTKGGSVEYGAGAQYTKDKSVVLYAVWEENKWSDWTTDASKLNDSSYVSESKTQYRYRDKSTKTSKNATESGWTRDDSLTKTEYQYSEYGSWSAWYAGNAPAETELKQVETGIVYGYYFYKCRNCGAHMHGYTQCYTWAGGCGAATYYDDWNECWSNVSWDAAGLQDWYGTGKYYTTKVSDPALGGGVWFKYPDHPGQKGYRYRTRTKKEIKTYTFYKWSDYSAWSDTAVTASNTRQVETRTVYRYKKK